MMFASTEFLIELTEFGADSNCKVIYSLEMLMTQLTAFSDKVIKNSKNGYNGYKFSIKQEV